MQLSLMNMINMNNIVIEDSSIDSSKVIDKSGNYILDIKSLSCDLIVDIKPNISVCIIQIIEEEVDNKIVYNILENSNVNISIFDDSSNSKLNIIINLNGKNSNINFNAGIISHNVNKYKIDVFHNISSTTSNVNIHGITVHSGKLFIENNGYIKKGSNKSSLNQDNKIITMDGNHSKIEPNLYIDEYDIEASHGAYIGKFDSDVLFYLESRGLDYKSSYNLLIKGFLLDGFICDDSIKDNILKIINKYWR